MPRGAKAVSAKLLTGAQPAHDNEFKVQLAERALGAMFLDETGPISSPMKAKGVGELGLCGVGAAIANAVCNATGVRVRDYPVTLAKLLHLLPERT